MASMSILGPMAVSLLDLASEIEPAAAFHKKYGGDPCISIRIDGLIQINAVCSAEVSE
jgi:hypothetical protein